MPRSTNKARIFAAILLIFALANLNGLAQEFPSAPAIASGTIPKVNLERGGWPFGVYMAPVVQPSSSRDSSRVENLIHDGKLSLTLEDTIALAIENNFDVELQRYNHRFAQTEILRSQGGGQLRGVPTSVVELPSGEGGPGEPLLTTVGGYAPVLQLPSSAADLATITGTQNDLSILSATPY